LPFAVIGNGEKEESNRNDSHPVIRNKKDRREAEAETIPNSGSFDLHDVAI